MTCARISPAQLPLPLIWPAAPPPPRVTPRRTPSPFERGPLVRTLRELNRWRQGPVVSPLLADHLGLSERTVRQYLARLEQAGMVRRPAGPRSGWVAL